MLDSFSPTSSPRHRDPDPRLRPLRHFDAQARTRIEQRLRWQELFQEHAAKLLGMPVLIQHPARPGALPGDPGGAPWFRAEYLGVSSRGAKFVVGTESVCPDPGTGAWGLCRHPGHRWDLALVVATIPFQAILDVVWDGQEMDPTPLILCAPPAPDDPDPYAAVLVSVRDQGRVREVPLSLGSYRKIASRSRGRQDHA
jgi:hypothetical protein